MAIFRDMLRNYVIELADRMVNESVFKVATQLEATSRLNMTSQLKTKSTRI